MVEVPPVPTPTPPLEHQTLVLTDPPPEKHHALLWGLCVLAVALTTGGIVYAYWQFSVPMVNDESVNRGDTGFSLISLGTNCLGFENDVCDEQLVYTDSLGNRQVVEENITQLFKESEGEEPNSFLTIQKFYFPSDSTKLFFNSFIYASSGCCFIYSFNVETKEFTPLTHGHYDPYFSRDVAAPDNSKIAGLGADEKSIEVVNIPEDSVQTIAQVGANESLVHYISGYGGDRVAAIRWLDNACVEYDVFQEMTELIYDNLDREKIYTQVACINSATTTSQESTVNTTDLTENGEPGGYSTDGTYVYYHSYGISPARKWVVEGADPTTFSVLDSKFAKDNNFVYENEAKAFVANTVSRDLANGTLNHFNYAPTLERDDEGNMYQYGVLAEVPDPDSFSRVSNPSDLYNDWTSYYKDKNHIYRLEGQEQILNILDFDVDSFDIVGYGASQDLGIYDEPVFVETLYMKDKDLVYVQLPDYSGSIKIIRGADPATFASVANQETYDAQDKNHKYLMGEIVE